MYPKQQTFLTSSNLLVTGDFYTNNDDHVVLNGVEIHTLDGKLIKRDIDRVQLYHIHIVAQWY